MHCLYPPLPPPPPPLQSQPNYLVDIIVVVGFHAPPLQSQSNYLVDIIVVVVDIIVVVGLHMGLINKPKTWVLVSSTGKIFDG